MRRVSACLCLVVWWITLEPVAAEPVTVHVHTSQRYDRSTALLAADIRRDTRASDLVTVTEIQGPRRSAPLHLPGDGWAGYTVGRTDVGVMWRLDRWRAVARRTYLATRRTFVTTGGFVHRSYVMAVVLEPRGRPGGRLLVTVGHMPSGVESGDRFRTGAPSRVWAWRGALAGWAGHVRALRARFHPAAVITAGDWNVNLRRPAWRRMVGAAFPAESFTWRRPYPRRGTHYAGRLIDATLTTLAGRARLMRHTPASDHTAYIERLAPRGR
jgi:hypothetical protein